LEKIILDTDIGFDADDTLALALLLKSDVEIKAITTVYEFTELKKEITKKLLELASISVPVYGGIDYRKTKRQIPAEVCKHMRHPDSHEGEGLFDRKTIIRLKDTPPKDDAIKEMHKIIQQDDISIVSIGPMTNIAGLIKEHPDVKNNIRHIYAMSGVLDQKRLGRAEYNVRADPKAAQIVYSSKIPMTIMPSDVTHEVWLDDYQIRRLEHGDALAQKLAELARIWNESAAGGRTYLHDPLAAAFLFWKDIFRIDRRSFEIDDYGDMTNRIDASSHITSCTKVEKTEFMDRFMRIMLDR